MRSSATLFLLPLRRGLCFRVARRTASRSTSPFSAPSSRASQVSFFSRSTQDHQNHPVGSAAGLLVTGRSVSSARIRPFLSELRHVRPSGDIALRSGIVVQNSPSVPSAIAASVPMHHTPLVSRYITGGAFQIEESSSNRFVSLRAVPSIPSIHGRCKRKARM